MRSLPPFWACWSHWPVTSKGLVCIFINVASIVSRLRRHYLSLFVDEHMPDVLLLAEHKLNSRHNYDLDGYTCFRQHRLRGSGGGTAVLVRNNIRCERVMLRNCNIEYTAVKIHRNNGGSTTVVSMYSPPREILTTADLAPVSELLEGGEVLVGGDFNAKHPYLGGSLTNPKGRVLYDFLLGCPDLDVCRTDGPTRVTESTASYIDIFLASSGLLHGRTPLDRVAVLDYESDHSAIRMVINGSDFVEQEVPELFNFGKIDKRRFNTDLSTRLSGHCLPLNRNATITEIDQYIEYLTASIRGAMDVSIPKRQRRKGLPDLPSPIKDLIAEKKRMKRRMHRTSDYLRKQAIKVEIKNLKEVIGGAIADFEERHRTNFLERIRVDGTTFRKVKEAAGLLTRNSVGDLDEDDHTIADDSGKAVLLARNFAAVHGGNLNLIQPDFKSLVEREVASLSNRAPLITFCDTITACGTNPTVISSQNWLISPNDIGSALRRRPNKRSSGLDGIPDVVLKVTNNVIWDYIAVIFNHCLNLGYFPMSWKRASVVPILKPGSDPGSCASYRPISLLSSLGKLLERFILDNLRDTILDKGILLDNQFGFKDGHNTSHGLMVLSDYVSRGLSKRYATIAVSLDCAKAFDTAWQEGIVYKMMNKGFSEVMCRMVSDFLRERTFSVKVGDVNSPDNMVAAGVPQGSLLGPILYNIFVSDIPLPSDGDLLLLYADDILMASSGACARIVNNRVNAYLETLNEYFVKWGIRLNVEKSVGIIFKGTRRYLFKNCRRYVPVLRVGSSLIPISDNMKYLGVIFNERFEFYRHLDHVLSRVKRIFTIYCAMLRGRNGLSLAVRLLIYKQIIRPIVAYAFPAWFTISSSQMERIRVWERRILSACLRLRPTYGPDGTIRWPSCRQIYDGVEFDRIDVFLVKTALAFLEKSADLDNQLVRRCIERGGDDTVMTYRYIPPAGLLTLRRNGRLFVNDRLLYYHRRFGSLDLTDTVYTTDQ